MDFEEYKRLNDVCGRLSRIPAELLTDEQISEFRDAAAELEDWWTVDSLDSLSQHRRNERRAVA